MTASLQCPSSHSAVGYHRRPKPLRGGSRGKQRVAHDANERCRGRKGQCPDLASPFPTRGQRKCLPALRPGASRRPSRRGARAGTKRFGETSDRMGKGEQKVCARGRTSGVVWVVRGNRRDACRCIRVPEPEKKGSGKQDNKHGATNGVSGRKGRWCIFRHGHSTSIWPEQGGARARGAPWGDRSVPAWRWSCWEAAVGAACGRSGRRAAPFCGGADGE